MIFLAEDVRDRCLEVSWSPDCASSSSTLTRGCAFEARTFFEGQSLAFDFAFRHPFLEPRSWYRRCLGRLLLRTSHAAILSGSLPGRKASTPTRRFSLQWAQCTDMCHDLSAAVRGCSNSSSERIDMSFWDIIWFIVISFAFIAYLMVMFSIITDLFRDRETGGFAKAVWILALIFLPFLTALIYLIARGGGMAERSAQHAQEVRSATDSYIKQVASPSSPADEVTKAKALLDAGAISPAEFESLKAKALSGSSAQ
ncbi:MAG: SHOCT domain-containing protein [Cellulomonas sp.]